MGEVTEHDTIAEPQGGLPLVRRFNALMSEKERMVVEAGGWVTQTNPAWRVGWRERMDALLADVRTHEAANFPNDERKDLTMPHPNIGGLPDPMPAPGLKGDYRDSCVICLRGTDTAVAVYGSAEAAIAFLMGGWGSPQQQAIETVRQITGSEPGMVPAGERHWGFRLCSDCAASNRSGKPIPVGPIAGDVPVIRFRDGDDDE